jgi:signal peptide peptidase SppA
MVMSLLDHVLRAHWAMDPDTLDRLRGVVERHDSGVRYTPEQIQAAIGRPAKTPHPRDRTYEIHQGVALVPVQGVLCKHAGNINDVSSPSGTSYESFAADLRTAINDPEVRGIMLHVESGGGIVDGGEQALSAVTAARAVKPVRAFIDGIGASMAYRIAMTAERVDATPSSLVGSIGVIATVRGTSEKAAKNGDKFYTLRSGKQKAPGQPGEDWNPEQLASRQRVIDQMAELFYADVAKARGLSGDALKAVTDGDCYLAADGQRLGLIDSVTSFDEALTSFVTSLSTQRRPAATGSTHMKIAPDRLAALIKDQPAHAVLISSMAVGNADAAPASEADILGAIEREGHKAVKAEAEQVKAELAKAKTDHANGLAAKDAEIADLKAKLELSKPVGVAPLVGGTATPPAAPGAVETYHAKVAELKAAGDQRPSDTIARKFPQINKAFIDAVNTTPKKKEA